MNNLSVFGNSSRTNNGQESINAKLKRRIGLHPNFWTFLSSLKSFTISCQRDYERLERGSRISRAKKRETLDRSSVIKRATELLNENEVTLIQFLSMVSGDIDQFFDEDNMFHDAPSAETTVLHINEFDSSPNSTQENAVSEISTCLPSHDGYTKMMNLLEQDQEIISIFNTGSESTRLKCYNSPFGAFNDMDFTTFVMHKAIHSGHVNGFDDLDEAEAKSDPKRTDCLHHENQKMWI